MVTVKKCIHRWVIMGIILITFTSRGISQFTIIAYPPPNNFVFEDLWHFTATGPQNSNFTQFYVTLRVFNDQNTILFKSNTTYFALTAGSFYVDKPDLSPIQPISSQFYDYLYQDVLNSGGFFPAGNYVVQFGLWGRPTDGEFSELAQHDYTISVEMLFPPILITPPDLGTVNTPYPLLSWLPAYQASAGQQILYNLRMTEIYEGQTPNQSLSSNPAYFEQFDLPITMINYPPDANPIELNHWYAWQVAATIKGVPVAYSQIWSFTYAIPDSVEEKDTAIIYAKLTEHLDANYFTVRNNLLSFVYHYNDYSVKVGDSLRFEITDEATHKRVAKTGDNIYIGPYTLHFGENMYQFDLSSCGLNLPEEKYYILRVSGPVQSTFYLRFYHEKGNGEIRCK